MKTIIAGGGRDLAEETQMHDSIKSSGFTISELVCGMSQGIDLMAKAWAIESGIAITDFPAASKRFSKAAGTIRNQQMANYAEALIAIWDGKSHGARNMIQEADKSGHLVHVHLVLNGKKAPP